jgi:hypothetical protein
MSTRVVALSPVFENQQYIDINTVGSRLTYLISGYTGVAIQLLLTSGTWSAGVISVQLSMDGNNWSDFPISAVTYTSANAKQMLTVTGYNYLRLVVTTANASSVIVTALVNGVDENG